MLQRFKLSMLYTGLLAALVAACLPGGLLPHLGGPCGKALCLCTQPSTDNESCCARAVDRSPANCESCLSAHRPLKPARPQLTFSSDNTALHGIGWHTSYESIWTALEATPTFLSPCAAGMKTLRFDIYAFLTIQNSSEIPTPPPRVPA